MQGKIRVLIPLEPWRISLTLIFVEAEGLKLLALLPQGFVHGDVLQLESRYELQWEPEEDAEPKSGIIAWLRASQETPLGRQLEFALAQPWEKSL